MQPTKERERRRLIDGYLSYAKSICRDETNQADYWAVDAVNSKISTVSRRKVVPANSMVVRQSEAMLESGSPKCRN